MRFASRSLVIISVLGLLASTSAKPTYLRKGHDRQTVSTKSLRQFDPRKAPTRRAFGAAPHPSHVPMDRFNGFWDFDDETPEGDDEDYSYDFLSTGNTLRSGPDDTQSSNANSNIPVDAAGGIPHSFTPSSVAGRPAVAPDLSSSPVGLAPAESFEALQNAGASGSSPRGASGLFGNLFNVGTSGSSPSFRGVANTKSTFDGVRSASSSSPAVIDNVATAPNRGSSFASSGISSQNVRPGHSVSRMPTGNEYLSRSERLGVAADTSPKLPTSGSSVSPNSIGNVRYPDPISKAGRVSRPTPGRQFLPAPRKLSETPSPLEPKSDTPVVGI